MGERGSMRRARQYSAALADAPAGLTAAELRAAIPMIDVKVEPASGDAWGSSRLLVGLGAAGDIQRADNTGHWRTSRPRYVLTRNWYDAEPQLSAADGYRELVRSWLYSFGPGTEDDLVWWLGSTKGIVRAALAELKAVSVSLDGGDTGWLLPDDINVVETPESWVALLPVLDPTVMGWRSRDFYLGPHAERLFEARGNAGTTVWVDGRVVGCWVQSVSGVVHVSLIEDVANEAREALDAEAERLTAWLAGERVGMVYVSPAMKDALSSLPS
jgi:hypothetical protein